MSRILPILFNTEMVRAIIENRKTSTRRCIRPPYFVDDTEGIPIAMRTAATGSPIYRIVGDMPYPDAPYTKGDIVYVRETWSQYAGRYVYKASADVPDFKKIKWHPSIHMPKEAARIWLKITDVKVERLQDITAMGCISEGVEREALTDVGSEFILGIFHDIWDSTIKKSDLINYGWEANPWVWVIDFEQCEKPKEA